MHRPLPRLTIIAVAVTTVLSAGSVCAQGRPLNPRGRQDLTFGLLLPGVPVQVSPLDGANAGQFEIRGRRNTEIRVDLTLPAAMVSGRGATVPLQFAANDGGVSPRPSQVAIRSFDPRVPLLVRLPGNGRMYLFLGGTALPGPQQEAGNYRASITLTVAYTGN